MKRKITKAILRKKERRRKRKEINEAWARIRLEILERDNNTCQLCRKDLTKVSSKARSIHHVVPRQFKELFLDKENLLTLCSSCHHWSKNSPHQNSLYFSEWFKSNFSERFFYLLKRLEELNQNKV